MGPFSADLLTCWLHPQKGTTTTLLLSGEEEMCAHTVDAVRHTESCVLSELQGSEQRNLWKKHKGSVLWELSGRQDRQALPSAEAGGLKRASHILGPSRLMGRSSV